MGFKSCFCAALFCLAASGCSNNEVIIKKQAEMEARLEQLIQGNAGTTSRLAELGGQFKELQHQVSSNSAELAELKPQYLEIKASQEVGAQPRVGAAKIVVVNRGGGGDVESAEQDAYMKAFGLFSTNDYNGAIEAFTLFIRRYPRSEYAGNAQYWIGECYYTQRDFSRALEAFTRTIENYAQGKKVPDAMLKVGYSLISLNQREKARVALESLVEKFPKSPAAQKARERLSRN